MRAGLRAILEDEAEARSQEASDGEKALQLALKYLPDIVLMDIGMPGMDGIEVTQQIKAPQVKVLILSV
jgi:YesN/AraC family two-component response regulator